MTAKIVYQGKLRTSCEHLASGNVITTDAPIDNKGKGEYFSPTDLVATAMGSCALTIMGIYCQEHNIDFDQAQIDVTKIMASNPRRIETIILKVDLSGNNWDEKTVHKVIQAGKSCPVGKTLGENVKIEWEITW
ncbi:MAG: OsmC family protein [Crocinitomicaceae bacterium]|nr:OsmC family protein [Crocinitomicaceae bacterium]MCF8410903.1 OsmC family protein [Crocinitomicaceae bacterium]MCF8444227.1 OsmC family protein [Crocinitomicaceae bacterium]